VIWRRNQFKNISYQALVISGRGSGQGSINTAYDHEASYNLIDGACQYWKDKKLTSSCICNGIQLGGGAADSRLDDVHIFNNVVVNVEGTENSANPGIAFRYFWTSAYNWDIHNNISYNPGARYDIYWESTDGESNVDYDYNAVVRLDDPGVSAIFWNGAHYDYDNLCCGVGTLDERTGVGSNNLEWTTDPFAGHSDIPGSGDYNRTYDANDGTPVLTGEKDLAGKTVANPPEIGAYEYQEADSVPPNPPSGLRVVYRYPFEERLLQALCVED
jgi:hypothetical protein